MMRSSTVNEKTCITVVAVLALGFTGGLYAQSSLMSISATGAATAQDNAGKKGEGSYNKKDNPTRGTKDTLGSDEPGSSGSGAATGSSRPMKPEGRGSGRSTGDKGFSNLRDDKGGKGSGAMLGGSTDTKAGHAGESIGSGGTGKSDKSKIDVSAPVDGSSEGIAK